MKCRKIKRPIERRRDILKLQQKRVDIIFIIKTVARWTK